MARKKTEKSRVSVKAMLSSRLREIRQEQFGEHGGPELARRMGLPARTWYNYEAGVTVPAEVLLSFIDQTGTNSLWLFNGEGPKYRREMEDRALASMTPIQMIRRGLEKLELTREDDRFQAPAHLPAESLSDFVAIALVPPVELCGPPGTSERAESYILAHRQWLLHPEETVGIRLEDDAMLPILPRGSVVAVDRTVTAPLPLEGKIVAACVDGQPIIRRLEISGRHLILRPDQPTKGHPIITLSQDEGSGSPIVGQVVWSWSRFSDA